ncbi:hypothetical protein [uncultured Polaribacter sp.]|jgi:hypothetical protein|uniref:hypothetical protein n=1 Tax=uncultured Polaribacter sp. TaxID=174711 RepID=UPI00260EBB6A|nr:hypothetical protein [uncultured Polaribacter sp.]
MHKKLESDLISLAHSILQMKSKDNVFLLKEKSKEIYEKLSVLAFVEEYVNSGPNLNHTKEEVFSQVENAFQLEASKEQNLENLDTSESVTHEEEESKESIEKIIEEVKAEEIKEEIIEQPFDELEELMLSEEKPVNDFVKVEENKTSSLEEELQDTISVDQLATLFDTPATKSLNDRLAVNIQIGLNDRIAFVKSLFDGSQEDFNRVVSQLNTYATEKEAKKFIHKMVKPDYDWSQQEELEARFIEIVERKFA